MTQRELTDVFWEATVCCQGMDPADPLVQDRVRKSWPKDGLENSNWKPDENVVFIRISPGFDRYGELHDVDHVFDPNAETQKEVVSYHRSYCAMWICYGPDADDNADTIRIGILRQKIREYLAQYNIAVQPHISNPVRMTEQDETGETWERTDLKAEFYQLETREYPEEHIEGISNIQLI